MTIAPGDPHWRPPPASPRNGCLQALLILIGVILLLPGVCGVLLVSTDWREVSTDQGALLITLGLLALGAIGIVVIWLTVRRRR
ncbi:MAG TPA: hypothetical protein VGG01_07700 [Xanthobacteraceae bacterium]|jgi:hypothetical protein